MATVCASLMVSSLGRPALVMDKFFQDGETFPAWTTGLKWRGRTAVLLAVVSSVAVFVLLDG